MGSSSQLALALVTRFTILVVVLRGGDLLAQRPRTDKPGAEELAGMLPDEEDAYEIEEILDSFTYRPGNRPNLLPALKPYLNHEHVKVRKSAIAAILANGGKQALIEPLLRDADEYVRVTAIDELTKLGAPIELILSLAADPAETVREAVILSLAENGVTDHRLRKFLNDDEATVRSLAARALVLQGVPPATFHTMLSDPDQYVRSSVGAFLLRYGDHSKAVHALLDDADSDVRSNFAHALLVHRVGSISEPLMVLAADEENFTLRLFRSLGPKTQAILAPELLSWFDGDDPQRRENALFALAEFKEIPAACMPQLRGVLQSPFADSRIAACQLLPIAVGAEVAVEELRECFSHESPDVRVAAAIAARKLKLPVLLPQLRLHFADPDPLVRIQTAHSVAVLDAKDRQCVDVITNTHQSSEADIDTEVIEALAAAGSRAVVAKGLLREFLPRPIAVDALAQLIDADDIRRWASVGENGLSVVELDLIASHTEPISGVGPIILEALSKPGVKEDWGRIRAIFAALGNVQDFPIAKLSPSVISENEAIRNAAQSLVVSVGKTRPDEAADFFLKLLDDPRLRVQVRACRGLCKLHEQKSLRSNAMQPLVKKVSDLVRRLSESENTLSVSEVFWLIYNLGSHAEALAPALKTAITRHNLNGYDWEYYALQSAGVDPTELIVGKLLDDDPEVRIKTAELLGSVGSNVAIPHLARLIDDVSVVQPPGVRPTVVADVVIEAIAELGSDATLVPQLIEVLNDPQRNHEQAARALAAIGPAARQAVPTIMRAAKLTQTIEDKLSLYSWGDYITDLHLARALALIEPKPIGLTLLRRAIRERTTGTSWYNGSSSEEALIDLVLELGDRAKQLGPEFKRLLEEHELLDPDFRAVLAYLLARIEPENPKWRSWLERQVARNEVGGDYSNTRWLLLRLETSEEAEDDGQNRARAKNGVI
ncbi:MAG: HEAT repeat domain-containing protein [Planctomycetaceae bacterium]